jgi:hypothetical protein
MSEGPQSTKAYLKSCKDKASLFLHANGKQLNTFAGMAYKDEELAKEFVNLYSQAPLSVSRLGVNDFMKVSIQFAHLSIDQKRPYKDKLHEATKAVGSAFVNVNFSTFLSYINLIRKASSEPLVLPSKEFAKALHAKVLEFLVMFPPTTTSYRMLLNIARTEAALLKYDLTIKPAVLQMARRKLSSKVLSQKPAEELHLLLNGLLALFQADKQTQVLIEDGVEVFEAVAQVVIKQLAANEVTVEDAYSLLRVYINMDRGTEDFLRVLEAKVIGELSQLAEDKFTNLIYLYKNRIVFDVVYIHNSILKPFHDELIRRINAGMSPEKMHRCIHNFSTCPIRYGVYCEPTLVSAIKAKVSDAAFLEQMDREHLGYFLSTIMTFLSNISYFSDSELMLLMADKAASSAIGDLHLLSFTASFVKHCLYHQGFWDLFIRRFPEILRNVHELNYVFTIMLAMKELHEQMPNGADVYKQLLACPEYQDSQDRITAAWRTSRDQDLLLSKSGFMHSNIAIKLQEAGIHCVSEYYDNYYIDLAIPDRKLAIEFCGPSHFLMPANQMTGKTYHKHMILEKQGWKVIVLSFHERKLGSDEQLLQLIQTEVPLKF